MDALLGTIRARRDELVERGALIAETTRDRGVHALGKVRNGAMDWRQTLAARQADLPESTSWFHVASFERLMLERIDRVLAIFSARVRAEIKRLRQIELPARAEPADDTSPTRAKKKGGKRNGAAPKRLVLPIPDYETLTAREVLAELPRLSDAQRRTILEFERAHKKRRTIVGALEARA
jgi:hypothetical protein